MIRRPPRSTRTDTRLPYTTLFRSFRVARILVGGIFEPGLHLARQLDRHRLAKAILRLARCDANPAFRNRIFLDVGALLALEADADTALQHLHVEMVRARIGKIGRDSCRERVCQYVSIYVVAVSFKKYHKRL